MPTVSVVVPTYNRARLLHRSIDSVLDQTFEDLELIVVDDASTDRTETIVDQYDDDRITYLRHDENRGASAARNTGIEHASGDYFAFLDSDDEWLPRKLERQLEELRSRPDDWVAAYCSVNLAVDDENPIFDLLRKTPLTRIARTEGAEGGRELVKDVLQDDLHTSAGSTLLVEAETVYEIDGFDPALERFQDPEFLIRMLREGKLAYVDETLVRRYDTGRPPAEVVEKSSQRYLEKFSETVERLEAEGYDVRGAHHGFLARFYLEEGKLREAVRHGRQASAPEPRQYPGLLRAFVSGVSAARNG